MNELKNKETGLLIAKVIEVIISPFSKINEGQIDLEKTEMATISSLDDYHNTNRIFRLSAVKCDELPDDKY